MTRASLHAHRPVLGGFCVTGSALLFSVVGLLVKHATATLPAAQVVFFRNLFGLLCLLPWLLHGGPVVLHTSRLRLHLTRAATGLAAMYCYFFAIAHLPLATSVLLNFTAPLFIPLIARVALREHAGARVAIAIGVGFAGVALILRPGGVELSAGAWAGLLAGLFAAGAMVSVRALSATEPTTRTVFYFALVGTLATALPLPGIWEPPGPRQWLDFIAIGACATAAQLLLTRGYAHARAAQVGPFHYTAVVFAAVFGWWFWGERLDAWTAAGAVLICLAGVLTMRAGVAAGPGRAVVR